MKLTDKQKRFCEEYVKDLNATQAAIRAGYSEKTAYSIGQRLLKNVEIKKLIEKLQKDISDTNNISTDTLVNDIKTIIYDDIKNYVEFKKTKRGMKVGIRPDINEVDTKNIQLLETLPGGRFKIKLYSRQIAQDQLHRHVGFYNDQITIKNNLEAILSDMNQEGRIKDDDLKRIAELLFQQQKKFIKGQA